MTGLWLAAAAARNRARRIRGDADGDRGFMLVYVLMVTTIVTVLVTSTLVASAGSVVPAEQAAYDEAATAAAQGGLQAFLGYADTQCAGINSSVATCNLPVQDSGTQSLTASGGYTATYQWHATKGTTYYRVTSTGHVVRGGVHATRILVADVAGGVSSNLLDAGFVTQLETQAPDVAQMLYPSRTIALNANAITAAGIPNTGSAVSWSGAQAGSLAGAVNVCNSLYGGANGRVNNPPPNAPNPYVDWSESGTVGTASYTNFQPCQVTYGHATQFLGPGGSVQSKDAMLLSNSYPGGTGPTFNQPVYTGYNYTAATDGSCGVTGQNYRTFNLACAGYPIDIGGTPAGAYVPTYLANLPNWPTDGPKVTAGSACVYNGPTRILLNSDGSALVTSPQTTSVLSGSNLACYGGAAPNTMTGLLGVTVSDINAASHGVVYVQNNGTAPVPVTGQRYTSTGWPILDTRTNPVSATNAVFYATTPASGPTSTSTYVVSAADGSYTPVIGDNPSTKADGAWTPQWTSDSSGTTCNTSTATTDLRFYRCYAANGAYDATAYVDLKTAIKAAVASSPSSYATANNLNALVTTKLTPANSSDANNANPSNLTNASHRWQASTVEDAATTDGCTPSTGSPSSSTSTVPGPINDPLFQQSKGTQTTTSQTKTQCFTTTVTLQVGTCSLLSLGICVGSAVWGNGTAVLGAGAKIAQFKVTEKVVTTTVTSSSTASTSQFPLTGDVSTYAAGMTVAGPGDLYVQGQPKATLALAAQNDVVVTNTLQPAQSTNAIEIVAKNNVRVYHPVGCASTDTTAIANTTPGFCPNDITGLYSGVLTKSSDRPDQQYTNLQADQSTNGTALSNLSIKAAIFALGNATTSCPQPASGGGYCGGEFTADNYNRANGLGTLAVTGGIYQAHHGPVGQEWEIYDTTASTSRPYSGYQLTDTYQNLTTAIQAVLPVANVLSTTTTSSSRWRIVSVSTAPVTP